jgi:hypothetical protein
MIYYPYEKGLEVVFIPLPGKPPKNPPVQAGLVERQQVPVLAAFSKHTGLVPFKSPAVYKRYFLIIRKF